MSILNNPLRGCRAYISRRFWILGALLLGLGVLAGIQYRWISQVAEADREHTKANLTAALADLESDFDIEVTRAFVAFQVPFPNLDYAERYKEWLKRAPYPSLIRGVYVVRTGQEDSQAESVIPGEPPVPSIEWQQDLPQLRPAFGGALASASVSGPIGLQAFSVRGGSGIALALSNSEITIDGNPAFVFPMLPPASGFESLRVVTGGEDKHAPFQEPQIESIGVPNSSPPWAVLVFDAKYISTTFLPRLVQHYFQNEGGPDYDILVVERYGATSSQVVFPSQSASPERQFARPDGKIILFKLRLDCFSSPSAMSAGVAANTPELRVPFVDSLAEILARKPATCNTPAPTQVNSQGLSWEMLVRYRAGSLDQAIATFRHRNLILSGTVLLLLGLATPLVVLLTERARALAEMQADFVLGVSHELRTPLTIIRVAADNLERGLVENSEQAQKYGKIIHTHASELSNMVEETLALARLHSVGLARHRAVLAPVQIVRVALADNESVLRNVGMEVQLDLAPDLPPINGDVGLLKKCLDNLIQNAVKYASEGGWVAIRAQKVIREEGERIQISVEDRGPGISPDDLPHLFDPFYRGHRGEASQVPGIGLGLTLVKRVVEAHGGTAEVESGNVTRFSIFLPPHHLRPDGQKAVLTYERANPAHRG